MARETDPDTNVEDTPTWTVVLTCSVFVLISFILEQGIRRLTECFRRHHREYLNKALDKIKDELMQLGFISLLLTVFQTPLSRICIPESFTHRMLPCKTSSPASSPAASEGETSNRKLLHFEYVLDSPLRRFLASEDGATPTHCEEQGKASFLSSESIHQLHIFIFVLAIVHVLLSGLTMIFGRYKIYGWKVWEGEATAEDNDPTKGRDNTRYVKNDQFIKDHAGCGWKYCLIIWIVSFFRQFGRSVTKHDYQTLRRGFINTHMASNKKYDFYTYIMRSLEDDFEKVVGISGTLWLLVMVFLILNINGFHTFLWMAFIPLILLLIVGTKLQQVITILALDFAEKNTIVSGDVIVKPKNDIFWFYRPEFILHLIHLILIENAFEMAFFFWVWLTYGFDSCLMENLTFIIIRLFMGVFTQILVSYITLPLYALVTQMGSNYKKAIFTEPIRIALESWSRRAKEHTRSRENSAHSGSNSIGSASPLSPKALLPYIWSKRGDTVEFEGRSLSFRATQD